MMTVAIQVLGVKGYNQTDRLLSNVGKALSNLDLDLSIEEVTEVNQLMAYEINRIPALVVGGKVVTEKRIPTINELEILFNTIFKKNKKQKEMKTILFPTDFSEAAEKAFVYALNFAKKIGASITTLHVYELPDIRGVKLPHSLMEIYESIDLETFENYKTNVPQLRKIAEENNLASVPIYHTMEEGETIPTIQKIARKTEADMIIIGTKGATGLKEVFIGSVASSLIEKAPCPVLIVPEKAVFDGKIDNIAMTTSFKKEEEKALKTVLALAGLFQAEVHCFNVDLAHVEPILKRMEAFKDEFKDEKNVHFEVLDSIDLEATINDFLHEKQIDLLAMLTHKRKRFLDKIFSYSLTKQLANHLDKPVLAMPLDTI
jgi:nucleotide-binding universal stress UspA family protein